MRFCVLPGDRERPGLEEVEPLAEVGVVVVDEVGEGGVREEVGPVRQLQLPPGHLYCDGLLLLLDCSTRKREIIF